MAFKLVALVATLAVANAGFIDAPGHLAYTGNDYHHGAEYAYNVPVAKTVATYSSAPSVSSVYNSNGAHKTIVSAPVSYAAPIAKTISYSAPVHSYTAPIAKTISYAAPVTKTVSYSSPSVYNAHPVAKTLSYAAPVEYASKTLAYSAPAVKQVFSAAPAIYSHSSPSVYSHGSTDLYNHGSPSLYSHDSSDIYSHGSPSIYSHAAPITTYTAPIAKTISYAAPAHSHSYAPSHYSYNTPAIGASHQSVHHSHEGTISQYSKSVDTPYSSVHKYNTHITSEPQHHYQYAAAAPIVAAKTYAPVVATKSVSYSPAVAVAHTSFQGHGAHYEW